METQEKGARVEPIPQPAPQPPSNKRWLVAASAIVLALIVGLGTWAAIGGDGDVALEPQVEVVIAAIEARNEGDLPAYTETLFGDALSFEKGVHLAEALSHANHKTELVDCGVTGTSPNGESIVLLSLVASGLKFRICWW